MHTRQTYRTSLSNLTVNLSILHLLCGNMVGYDTVRTQSSQKIENVPKIFNMKRTTQGHLSSSFCFCNLVSFLSFFFFLDSLHGVFHKILQNNRLEEINFTYFMLQNPLSSNSEREKIDEVIWLFHKRNFLYFV